MPKIYNYVNTVVPNNGQIGDVLQINGLGKKVWAPFTGEVSATPIITINNNILLNPQLYTVITNENIKNEWIPVYVNINSTNKILSFTSITNMNYEQDEELALSSKVKLRLVNESDIEVYTLVPETILNYYEGIENAASMYIIPPGYSLEFMSDSANVECVITVSDISSNIVPIFYNVTTSTDEWDIFYNNNTDKKQLIRFVSITNAYTDESIVSLRVLNSDNTLKYTITPPMLLKLNYGVENQTSIFILNPGEKLSYFSDNQSQLAIVLQNIE